MRTLLVLLLVLPLAVPALLYVLLSVPAVQSMIGARAEKELSRLLGSEVRIGRVEFYPFNRLALTDVSIADPFDEKKNCLTVGHLGLGVSLSETLWNRHPVITYAELIDLSLGLRRATPEAPLNIEPIIERFQNKDKTKPQTPFHLGVNMVVIRRSSLSYDVESAPRREEGVFDPSHISVSDLRADLRAPVISDKSISAQIKRLAASEQSGLTLTSLAAQVDMSLSATDITDLSLTMPGSRLQFDDIVLGFSPLDKGTSFPGESPIIVNLLPGAHVSTADIAPLLPALYGLDLTADLQLISTLSSDALELDRLSVSVDTGELDVEFKGLLKDYSRGRDSLTIEAEKVNIAVDIPRALTVMGRSESEHIKLLSGKLSQLSPLGILNLLGRGRATTSSLNFDGSLTTSCGDIDLENITVSRPGHQQPLHVGGSALLVNFNPSVLSKGLQQLTHIDAHAEGDLTFARNGSIDGKLSIESSELVWSGTAYTSLSAAADFTGDVVRATVESANPGLDFTLKGGGQLRGDKALTELQADLRDIRLATFLSSGKLQPYTLTASVDASVHGRKPDLMSGWVNFEHLSLVPTDGQTDLPRLHVKEMSVTSVLGDSLRTIDLHGDPFDLSVSGDFGYAELIKEVKNLIAASFPALLPSTDDTGSEIETDATLDLTLKPDTSFYNFFRLPVELIYPVTLTAMTDSRDSVAELNIDAPYLKQKDKLIEDTRVAAIVDGRSRSTSLSVATRFPTKNGLMDLSILTNGGADSLRTAIDWTIDAPATYKGDLALSTRFSRLEDGRLATRVDMLPGALVFNDSVWTLSEGSVDILPGAITVKDFGASRAGQSLAINGLAAADSLSRVEVSLDHIDLDYVFSTLALSDAVNFGGIATGTIYGDALLSPDPVLYTPGLHVDGITYNHCTFGDADITSRWDNNTHTIFINADISGADHSKSVIAGTIQPMASMLDFTFTADRAPASFMLPFMVAFTSKVDGKVSGRARLFGTFKDLDLEGDIYAQDLSLKLDFTNTTYTVSDSVHITPGLIKFDDVTISDRYGKTAKLSGRVGHNYFHDPTFEFNITDARDMLVYDVREGATPDPWYGTIFGNGGAVVTGVPGKIDIDVKMTTAPRSTFTFVLSDEEVSVEHDFVHFRDRDRHKRDSIAALDPTPLIIRKLRDKVNAAEEGPPTVYDMKFDVGIDSLATLYLIMDPKGGDKITAHGRGNLLMKYASDGDLTMHGEYTLTRGTYRFTLQDIIIKDFDILAGSRIIFLGDPYAAQLDIRAAHSIKANLSDLDESFLEDRELTSTSVRVNALMYIRGDMRHPDLKFDLSFPTLTADTERKIRSIISTDEMMSQQILYLLALERFYTPEYMGSTAHGGELMSVASSTLSSRLSSMLGQLSDSWTIAPAIRSDRGDFSDVQVDVSLSSQLLDNRLLFNGNLGYRDKSLNNNSFIGDFDIRYLLNRSGSIQLKAYNRYNDQNYYLKSALTTQGVGVVFRRDFDNLFSFLRPLRKKKTTAAGTDKAPVDSVKFNTIIDFEPSGTVTFTDSLTVKPTAPADSTGDAHATHGLIFRKREE